MGKAWKVLRLVLNQNTNNRNPSTFKIDDETVTDPCIISNEFNKYFVEIGPKLAENLNTPIDPLSYLDRNCNSIFLPEISENETLRAINSLKNASAGWDQIPTFIAKRSIQHYLKPLTYLINKSIHQGICPDELKVAKVFPVYKSGDKTNISNYRPSQKSLKKLYITMLLISLILIIYYPNSNLAFEKIIVQIMRS